MNIRCPSCQTVFRVDPAKVPAEGIRAKCSRCSHTFRIAPPGEQTFTGAARGSAGAGPVAAVQPMPAGAPASARPAVAASPTGTVAPPRPTLPTGEGVRPQPAAAAPLAAGARPSVMAPASTPVAPTAAAPVPSGAPRTPVFGSRDPRARAQRIARALISDIVAYHKKRVEETLASGRIRTEFRDEIMKSWDEYVAQVGIELAKGTPYFRDALNDILARGQRVF